MQLDVLDGLECGDCTWFDRDGSFDEFGGRWDDRNEDCSFGGQNTWAESYECVVLVQRQIKLFHCCCMGHNSSLLHAGIYSALGNQKRIFLVVGS